MKVGASESKMIGVGQVIGPDGRVKQEFTFETEPEKAEEPVEAQTEEDIDNGSDA